MMNEKKHERFIRIVERRMDVLINDFEKLGNCASKVSYDYIPRMLLICSDAVSELFNFFRKLLIWLEIALRE